MLTRSALMIAALVLAAPAVHAGRTETRPIQNMDFADRVRPGQRLEIHLDTGGDLEIEGWDRDEVRVHGEVARGACPEARVEFGRVAGGVQLDTGWEGEEQVHHCSISITVRVPRKFDVRVRSAGGGIHVTGLRGRFEGHTGGGELDLTAVRGVVSLRTGGGEIRVRDSDLDGSLGTGGGEVRFANVTGDVVASSGSMQRSVRGTPRNRRSR